MTRVAAASQCPDLAPLVVAIPARDEADRIGRTLAALGRQLGEYGHSLRVVVLANNCSDDTARVARQAAETLALPTEVIEEDFPSAEAHIGRARGRVLELAADRLQGHPEGLIATTDADTVVAPDWAAALRRALQQADVVGGRILTLPEETARLPREVRRVQLQDAAYHLLGAQLESRIDPDPADPWPRHHQHFGASLGLRLSAWNALGAWPQVRCLEDVALVHELRHLDLRVRHCPRVRVWTSARASGRVETGLSTQLREWEALRAEHRCWLVPGAAERQAEALARAEFRRRWGQLRRPGMTGALTGPALLALEQAWMVGPGDLQAALTAPTLGLGLDLAMHARHQAGHWFRHHPAVPVEQALADLRALLRSPAPTPEPPVPA